MSENKVISEDFAKKSCFVQRVMLTKVNCKKQPLTCLPQYKLVGHISRHSRTLAPPGDHKRTSCLLLPANKDGPLQDSPCHSQQENQTRHRKQLSSATGQLKAMNFIPERREGSRVEPTAAPRLRQSHCQAALWVGHRHGPSSAMSGS